MPPERVWRHSDRVWENGRKPNGVVCGVEMELAIDARAIRLR
jgi:hypothetical protein